MLSADQQGWAVQTATRAHWEHRCCVLCLCACRVGSRSHTIEIHYGTRGGSDSPKCGTYYQMGKSGSSCCWRCLTAEQQQQRCVAHCNNGPLFVSAAGHCQCHWSASDRLHMGSNCQLRSSSDMCRDQWCCQAVTVHAPGLVAIAAGGWGPALQSVGSISIPCKDVMFMNNLLINFKNESAPWGHFAVSGAEPCVCSHLLLSDVACKGLLLLFKGGRQHVASESETVCNLLSAAKQTACQAL